MEGTTTTEARTMIQLPTVQLIGAQKAGTSAIADWLFESGGFSRPKVFENDPPYYSKEVHFFDCDHRYHQGVTFYADRYKDCKDSSRTLDATPDTLQFADRVRETYDAASGGHQTKSLQVLVILRDPVSRELSYYNHLAYDCRTLPSNELTTWHRQVTRADGSIMTFDEFVSTVSLPALHREPSGPGRSTRHGKYVDHLRPWFQCFDRAQILVLSYEELQCHPERLQQRIEMFLGVTITTDSTGDSWLRRRANANESNEKVRHIAPATSAALYEAFRPFNESLYELLDANPGPPMEQRPFPHFVTYGTDKE
jgi:Sulfotransferase domain